MSQLTAEELTALKSKAKDVRIDILKMITKANSGHTGGSLSAADILTLLFFHEMKVDPKDPKKADRDRLVHLQRPCSTGPLCRTGRKRIFPQRRAGYTSSGRSYAAGASGHETYTGCRHDDRFSGAGHQCCLRYGACFQDGQG